MTGIYFFLTDLGGKRLGILRELLPDAATVAVLTNPTSSTTGLGVQDVQAAAHAIGMKVCVFNASNPDEIDTAFATSDGERPAAFLVINDPFLTSRRSQIVLLAARHAVPAIYSIREYAEAGGLVSYRRIFPKFIINSAHILAAFSRARALPTCQSCNRPNSNWSSISRPQERSDSQCRPRCSPAPTR